MTMYLPAPKRGLMPLCGIFADPHGCLTEVLTRRLFLLRRWMAGLLFKLIRPPLRFVALGTFLCHATAYAPA